MTALAETSVVVRVESDIHAIGAETWDACACPAHVPYDPFVSFAFLSALEDSKAVCAREGWLPQHLVLEEGGQVVAVAPCYLKGHSQGEYIFDYGWAHAFERAGGAYYPKLQNAVPFTPVPGRRLLTRDKAKTERHEKMLLSGAARVLEKLEASSFHATFLTEAEWQRAGSSGLLQRTGTQYHWHNRNYESFDAFLDTLASRKRKAFRRERRQAHESQFDIRLLRGEEITTEHWDAMFAFYMDTGRRKWGEPYLNRESFALIGERMADDVLLVMVYQGDECIAGAMHMIGGEAVYGRYWGCRAYHPFLHFEVCYYQAMDYAIAHGLARVEAGAQGEHKLVRGYEPVITYSAHLIGDPRLRAAVSDFVTAERHHVEREAEVMKEMTPFKKSD